MSCVVTYTPRTKYSNYKSPKYYGIKFDTASMYTQYCDSVVSKVETRNNVFKFSKYSDDTSSSLDYMEESSYAKKKRIVLYTKLSSDS